MSVICLQLESVAHPALAEDDAAFAVDGGRIELHLAGDLAHQHEAGAQPLLVGARQVEHVGGGIEAGRGVGVRPELEPLALEDLDHLAFGHVGRPVERHMLDEVGEAALVVALADRAELEAEPERRAVLRRLVALDRIAHAVGQHAVADRRVGRDVGRRHAPRRGGGRLARKTPPTVRLRRTNNARAKASGRDEFRFFKMIPLPVRSPNIAR